MSNLLGQPIWQKGQAPRKVPALRKASKGATCSLRIPGVCAVSTETVVGSHIRLPNFCGVGLKSHDLFLFDSCEPCHAAFEARRFEDLPFGWEDALRALMESQLRRLESGLIILDPKHPTAPHD